MNGFFNLIVEVWNQDFLGISIGNVVISLIIIIFSIILRALVISRVFRFLEKLAKETETEADDILLETLERPLGNVPLALGLYLIIELLPLSGIADVFLTNIVKALIAYTIFSVLTKAVGPIFELLATKSWVTAALSMWLERFTRVLIWILAIAIILDIFGVEIGPIIAGLGLFSVAVALGAQDLFKNLISGILIIAENRFQPGDRIEVDGKLHGIVETIGFRSTMIRLFNTSPMIIPNKDLSDVNVTNHGELRYRRIKWQVNLLYSTSIDQLKLICDQITDYINNENEGFALNPGQNSFAKAVEFGASSIDVEILCYSAERDYSHYTDLKQKLVHRIMEIVRNNGSDFAFPSRSVYVESSHEIEP
tara:strand:+ start:2350 stop:3447 length:1098 start_codon:yes stop_codon:yes gene_type:complete